MSFLVPREERKYEVQNTVLSTRALERNKRNKKAKGGNITTGNLIVLCYPLSIFKIVKPRSLQSASHVSRIGDTRNA